MILTLAANHSAVKFSLTYNNPIPVTTVLGRVTLIVSLSE